VLVHADRKVAALLRVVGVDADAAFTTGSAERHANE
jgi:hypothetical protein